MPLVNVLLTDNRHDFRAFAINTVIDRIHTAHAAPVAFAEIMVPGGLIYSVGLLTLLQVLQRLASKTQTPSHKEIVFRVSRETRQRRGRSQFPLLSRNVLAGNG